MKKLLFVLTALAMAMPATATSRLIVNPDEAMVTVPGLEQLGPSRISTVRFCAGQVGIDNWRDLITDSEFEGMEICLREHT